MPGTSKEDFKKFLEPEVRDGLVIRSFFPRGIKISSAVKKATVKKQDKYLYELRKHYEEPSRTRGLVRSSTERTHVKSFKSIPDIEKEHEKTFLGLSDEYSAKLFSTDSSALETFSGSEQRYRHIPEPEILLPKLEKKSTPDLLLKSLTLESEKCLEELLQPNYFNVEFSHADHITETLMDLVNVGQVYGLDWKDICKCLTTPLVVNEGVYALDDMHDNAANNVNSNGLSREKQIMDALERKADMYATASSLLRQQGRWDDLYTVVAKMSLAVDALFCMEKIRDTNSPRSKAIIEHIGRDYGSYFEPTEIIYMDTGAHMVLFLELAKDRIKNKSEYTNDLPALKRCCNSSRRLLDIGDSLMDLRKDVEGHILNPFEAYVFSLATDEERDAILKATSSGIFSKDLEKIIQRYGQRITTVNMGYISDAPTNSTKSRKVKERILKIGEIILEMTEDVNKGKIHYNRFYNQTASELASVLNIPLSQSVYLRP